MNPLPASSAVSPVKDTGTTLSGGDRRSDLQARINQMQSSRLSSKRLPTVPALARLLPGGGLHAGNAYSVHNSTTVAMALLAGPAMAGSWCSVIGMPSFSVEAAADFGIELSRLILVPSPGEQWLTVTATMVDVVSVILAKAPEHLRPSDAARLKARMRDRGVALITVGPWPHSDSTLSVSASSWSGLGTGAGHLRSRRMTVVVNSQSGSGRPRSGQLWLSDLQQRPWMEDPLSNAGHTNNSGNTNPANNAAADAAAADTVVDDTAADYAGANFQPRLVGL